jgi:hypothetical protein
MTEFQEQWITSTLAPESISTKPWGNCFVHSLVNEDKSKQVFVLELFNGTLLVNSTIEELIKSKPHDSYSSACKEIVSLLNLEGLSI